MSAGKVDVLAVMRDVANLLVLEKSSVEAVDDLREARAAVAELIEADRKYDRARAVYAESRNAGWLLDAAIERRAVALARIGGGA